jgi:hypothetical protein
MIKRTEDGYDAKIIDYGLASINNFKQVANEARIVLSQGIELDEIAHTEISNSHKKLLSVAKTGKSNLEKRKAVYEFYEDFGLAYARSKLRAVIRLDKKPKCKSGNKPCGDRCVPAEFKCKDESEQPEANSSPDGMSKATWALIGARSVGGVYAGLVYGPTLAAHGVMLSGGLSDKALSKDFLADPRFNPDLVKSGKLKLIGEGAFGKAFLDKGQGIIYKESKNALEASKSLRKQGKPLSLDPISDYLKASLLTNMGRQNEHVAQYVAGTLGVGPKLLGKKGNIIGQEFLAGYTVLKGNTRYPEIPAIHKKAVEVVATLHLSGIAHNDLHRENFMIRRNGAKEVDDIKLIDFGMATVGNFRLAQVEAIRLSREMLPGEASDRAARRLRKGMVSGAFGSKESQRKALIDFYVDLGVIEKPKNGVRKDARLKCKPGNKECGGRCIPVEQTCRVGQPKKSANPKTRALIAGALIAAGSTAVLAAKNPKETAALGQAVADRLFINKVIEKAPPAVQSRLGFIGRLNQAVSVANQISEVSGTVGIVAGAGATAVRLYREVNGLTSEAANDRAEAKIKDFEQKSQAKLETLVGQEREKFQAEKEKITSEYESTQQELATELAQRNQEIRTLSSEKQQLQGEIDKKAKDLDLLKGQSEALNTQIKQAKAENKSLSLENQTLSDANSGKAQVSRDLLDTRIRLKSVSDKLKESEEFRANLIRSSGEKIKSLEEQLKKSQADAQSKIQGLINSRDTAIAKLKKTQADAIAKIEERTTAQLNSLRSELHQETMVKLTEQREQLEKVTRERVELAQMPKATRPGTLINTPDGINLTASARQGLPLVLGSGGLGLENFNQRTESAVRQMVEKQTQQDLATSNTQFRAEVEKIRNSGSNGPTTMWGRYNAALLVQERREVTLASNSRAIRDQYAQQMQELNTKLFSQASQANEFTPELLGQYDVQAKKLHKRFMGKLKQEQLKVTRVIQHNWKDQNF